MSVSFNSGESHLKDSLEGGHSIAPSILYCNTSMYDHLQTLEWKPM